MADRPKLKVAEPDRDPDAPDGAISNGQRAFWMFLAFMLVAPFFGGLAGAAMIAVAWGAGIAPETFAKMPFGEFQTHIAPIGVTAFVWSVIPAALTAVSLVPTVLKNGSVSLFMAGAVGVIAFTAAILLFPFPTVGMQPVIMFAAGLISVAVRSMLINVNILKPEPPATAS